MNAVYNGGPTATTPAVPRKMLTANYQRPTRSSHISLDMVIGDRPLDGFATMTCEIWVVEGFGENRHDEGGGRVPLLQMFNQISW